MKIKDPRIRTALVSVNPTVKNPAWHGAPTAQGVLRGVSSAVAVWRPYSDGSNIREIALHIAILENTVANRISGQTILMELKQRKTGWVIKCDAVDETQWKEEIALIKSVHERLVEALVKFNPAILDRPVGKNTTRNAVEFIHGVAEHNLYHTAQMAMLKTLARHKGLK